MFTTEVHPGPDRDQHEVVLDGDAGTRGVGE